jgi:peptide-methionine (S)-S-oxide reductase
MKIKSFAIVLLVIIYGCSNNAKPKFEETMIDSSQYSVTTFGGGCFWCTEAVFQRLKGVTKVESGYCGGSVPNPTYEEVCTGKTGHAECTQIYYDPKIISFTELLKVFFKTHDPTTLNRQGADVGTQYRSVIFYHNEEQRRLAEEIINKLDKEKIWNNPIVTEISAYKKFYKAEDYHQNYYNNNFSQPYCSFVITPKIEKFEKVFKDLLK